MATVGFLYGRMLMSALAKQIDWLNDDVRVLLTTATHVPDQDTHQYKSSITNEVAGGNGYTAGGVVLAGKAITYTPATNIVALAANNAQWPNSSITARNAHVYDNTGASDAVRPLIAYQQSDVDITSVNGLWEVAWHADGVARFTVA